MSHFYLVKAIFFEQPAESKVCPIGQILNRKVPVSLIRIKFSGKKLAVNMKKVYKKTLFLVLDFASHDCNLIFKTKS